jgi:LysR family transcriptional activator of nhaA
MSTNFNYRHLYYFWVVAKEGGITRAAERLGVAVQTISTQVRELEQALGYALLRTVGRGVSLTDAGLAAMRQAEQIFQLGEQLPEVVRDAACQPVLRLAVGVSDGLPKLVVRHLMEPILLEPNLRLQCFEDAFEDLLASLALHRIDMVLADRAAPLNRSLKVYSHSIGTSALAWYAPPSWYALARKNFPHSLAAVPVLLPTAHSAVRAQLDNWFERLAIRPRIIGEFEDSALLKTFGASGMGVFAASALVDEELTERYQVRRVAACEGVNEEFFLIGVEKKITHPLVQRLLPRQR